jgi:hypothetical protein
MNDIFIETGPHAGRMFNRKEDFHTLIIGGFTAQHFYRATERLDEQGRTVFIHEKSEPWPKQKGKL